MARTTPETITTIDGHYIYAHRAAVYLIVDGDEAAFVDTATRFSVPYFMDALEGRGMRPEQVRYIIVTHVHMDHSGGVAELAKHCPKATVIAHPRAGRHIVDPTRLVASVRQIYGDEAFDRLYGVIEPVDEDRVRIMEDGETLDMGSRTFTILHTPGHAKHHFSIHDPASNSMLCGDAFGLAYERLQEGTRPYLSYVCSPPDFDPVAAKASIGRMLETGAERFFVTHYGELTAFKDGAEWLYTHIDRCDSIVNEARDSSKTGDALVDFCTNRTWAFYQEERKEGGLDPDDEEVAKWATSELNITALGIAHLAEKRREAKDAD